MSGGWTIEVHMEIADATIMDSSNSGGRLEDTLHRAAETVLRDQGVQGAELSIILCSDERVQELNAEYRGVDRVTDVLSFAAREGQIEYLELPDEMAREMATELGDLFIAVPYARRQAETFGHSLDTEMTLLVVHGTLHLLGYDHYDTASTQIMWQIQERILASLLDVDLSRRMAAEAESSIENDTDLT